MSNQYLTILFISFLSLFLISCATLNKDECRTANWKLIGFEDGSNGYNSSRIGQHRKACAEYGISPNLDLYNQGHAEGLHKYCIPANAYNLGKRGSSYQGNCAGYNEAGFISAYNQGIKLYRANKSLNQQQKLLEKKQHELTLLKEDIHLKEQLIVGGKQSKSQIVLLLIEVKELVTKQTSLTLEINDLQDDIEEQSSYIAHLQKQNRY